MRVLMDSCVCTLTAVAESPTMAGDMFSVFFTNPFVSVLHDVFCDAGFHLFNSPLHRRVDHLPVSLHVYNGPAFRCCFVEPFLQAADAGIAVISPFSVAIGMVNVEGESRPRSGRGPLQHLQVAIRVAESGDGAAADVLVDPNRLASLVVNEAYLGYARRAARIQMNPSSSPLPRSR